MHPKSENSFSERMVALLRRRAEQRPLPKGYMLCSFNAQHNVPIASVVRHIEKVHNGHDLALIENAMYSHGTKSRMNNFFDSQQFNYRRWCASDRSASTDSSFSSCSSTYSVSNDNNLNQEDSESNKKNISSFNWARLPKMTCTTGATVQSTDSDNSYISLQQHACRSRNQDLREPFQVGTNANNQWSFTSRLNLIVTKRPRVRTPPYGKVVRLDPAIKKGIHHATFLTYSEPTPNYYESSDRHISLRQQYLYGVRNVLSYAGVSSVEQVQKTHLGTSADGTFPLPSSPQQVDSNAHLAGSVQTRSALSFSEQQERMWCARSIVLQRRTIEPLSVNALPKDMLGALGATARNVISDQSSGDEMYSLWCLIYPYIVVNPIGTASSLVCGKGSSNSAVGGETPNTMPLSDFIYHFPRAVLIMESESTRNRLLHSLKGDKVLMSKYEIVQ